MGKSAGNCPIELLAMYLNGRKGKNYDIYQILGAADSNIITFQKQYSWGYSMFYFIAASNDCHPNYVSWLMNKRTLSVKQINRILSRIPSEKKLMYDASVIEALYSDFQEIEVDDKADLERLSEELCDKKILILGPGTSVIRQSDKVKDFIINNNPVVITINYISGDIKPDYCFITNSKRYVQLSSSIAKNADTFKVIATSNVTSSTSDFDYVLKYSNLLDFNAQYIDNSFLMLLKVLKKIGVKNVYAAGFDGYATDNKPNYFDPDMEYSFTSNEAQDLNIYVIEQLNALCVDFSIEFITDSFYEVKDNA